MPIKKKLLIRTTSALATSCLAAASFSALAEEGKVGITKLLQSGYEVKAAYTLPVLNHIDTLLILQKGGTAYQCTNNNLGSASITQYSNTFWCVDIQDINTLPKPSYPPDPKP